MFFVIIMSGVICYLLLRWKNRKEYRLSSRLKNDLMYLPLLGNAYAMTGTSEDRMQVFQNLGRQSFQSGGLISAWLGQQLFVLVADPETLEVIMKTCLGKGDHMSSARELFGNGTVFAPVPIWRFRRKVIASAFSARNLNQFMAVLSEQSSVMVELLKEQAGKGTFSLWKYITSYTMNSVCETSLGIKINSQHQPNHPFLDAFEKYCKLSSYRLCMPLFAQKIYKYLPIYTVYMKYVNCMWDFLDNIIKKKREQIQANEDGINKGSKEKDNDMQKTFLELYIESSGGASGFTNVELREEALVLLMAGTDTSSVGAAFTCLMLARHPEVQDKVYAEIQNVFGDTNRPLTAEDLPRLKYLEAVVKESIRLYPPVPIILRKVEKDIVLPNGLELPKNTQIIINIWAVHHNPKYWGTDSDVFRPERFLEQELKHPAAFIPFSYGPRSCLGYKYAMMSMLTSVCALVRQYRLRCADADCTPHAPIRLKFDIMMKDVDNFELQLENRS